MAWSAEQVTISDKERDELMGIGAMIVADIQELVMGISSAIRLDFRHGVTLAIGGVGGGPVHSAQIILLFAVTDLGGSEETQVKAFIHERLLDIFCDPTMVQHKVQWTFVVEEKNEEERDG